MKVIKPVSITDAMLASSTVAEPAAGETLWSAATAYVAGNQAIRTTTHRVYECLVDHTNAVPEDNTAGTTPKWLDIGPTDRWAMFDNVVGTVTSGASPLAVVLQPGGISGIALLELVGREATVTVKDAPGGAVVYDRTIDLDGTIVESFYAWFFAPFEQRTDVVLADLPGQFTQCELTIAITATSGDASCGVCKPGNVIDIGRTQAGARVGIIDFSRKDRDAFGKTIVVERAFSKRASFDVVTDKAGFNRIFRALASLRATPAIYIGTEGPGYEPLLVYGFFRDFSIDVAYLSHHLCSLEVEGIV
jgi:hypothetical protein